MSGGGGRARTPAPGHQDGTAQEMKNLALIALGFLLGVGAARTYYAHRPAGGDEGGGTGVPATWGAAVDSLARALAGALARVVVAGGAPEDVDDGITFLKTAGPCVTDADLEVQGVLAGGAVVARAISHRGRGSTANGVDVILPRDADKGYREGQVIEMPPGHCARQVGVWRGRYTELPVVRIERE